MPAVLAWLFGIIGTGVVTWGIDSLVGNSSSQTTTPTVTTSFDWQGLLLSIAIAGVAALITWLILRRL